MRARVRACVCVCGGGGGGGGQGQWTRVISGGGCVAMNEMHNGRGRVCEPIFGLAVRLVSRKTLVRFRFGSPFSSKEGCGLQTVSCDFVPYNE